MVHLYSTFIQGILQRLCTTFTHTFIHYIAGGGNYGFRVLLKHSSTPTQGESGIKLSCLKTVTLPLSPWYWPSTAAGPRPSSVAGYQPPASDYQLLVTGPWPPATFHQSRSRPQVSQSGRGLPLSCQFRCGYLTSYQLTKNYNLLANGHRPCQTAFGALN